MKDISQEIIIKQVSPDQVNLNEVVAIIHEAFGELLKQGIDSPTAHISTEELKKRNHTHYFCAYDKEKLIGFVNGKLYLNRTCYFDIAAILPIYRRKGIGNMLFDAFEKKAFDAGVKYVFLNTMLPARTNIEWYQRRGYIRTSVKRYTTTYFSVVLKKYYTRNILLQVRSYISYILSSLGVCVVYKNPSEYTVIGKLMYKIKNIYRYIGKICH